MHMLPSPGPGRSYIYNAESRMIFGSTSHNRISRFADEIPGELVERSRSREYAYRPESITFGSALSGGRGRPPRPRQHIGRQSINPLPPVHIKWGTACSIRPLAQG